MTSDACIAKHAYPVASPGLGFIKHLKLRIFSNLKIELFNWYIFHLRRKLRKSSIWDVLWNRSLFSLFVVYSLSHNYQGARVAQWVRSLDL